MTPSAIHKLFLLHIIIAHVRAVRVRRPVQLDAPPDQDENATKLRNVVAQAIRSIYPLDDYWSDYCQHELPAQLALLVVKHGLDGSLKLSKKAFTELQGKESLMAALIMPHVKSGVMPQSSEQACQDSKSALLQEASAFTLTKWLPQMQKTMSHFTSQINIPELPDSMKDMIKTFISEYFENAQLELKLPMIEAYFTAPPLVVPSDANMSSPEVSQACFETMGVVLQGGGPFVQKMLQSAGDKVAEDLRQFLAVFKDGIKGMSPREFLNQVRLAYGFNDVEISKLVFEDGSSIWLPLDPRRPQEDQMLIKIEPTNAASIGQGHLAKLADKTVWMKVKRPFLREKMMKEFSMMDDLIADSLGAQQAVKEIEASIAGELNWKQEFVFMKRGEEVYNRKVKGVRSVNAIAAYPVEDPTIIIMEALQGSTLAAWIDADATSDETCNAAGLFRDAFRLWAREALVGSGFFHGDPHAGNILIDNGQLTFIDFGNSYQTMSVLLYPFAAFILGTFLRSPRVVLSALEVSQNDEQCPERLTQELNKLYDNSVSDIGLSDYASTCATVGVEWCSSAADGLTSLCTVPEFCKGIGKALHNKILSKSFDGAERLARDAQTVMTETFKVLVKNADCVSFPDGLFNFGRALDLLSNSFAQMWEKKRELLEEGSCLHLLQSPMLQIAHSLSWTLTKLGLKTTAKSLVAGLQDAIGDNFELLVASFLIDYTMVD